MDVSSSGFSSGEVCYLLNNSTSKGDVIWGQNIDNGEPIQDYPVIGSAKVYFIDGKYTNAPEHNFDEGNVIVESTCIENGVAVYTCLDCDYKFTEVINNHRYESVTTTIKPTHTEEGVKKYTCECGYSSQNNYINTIPHTYTSSITTPATHLTKGVKTFTCAIKVALWALSGR